MGRVYYFLLALPDTCSGLSLHELLLMAALVTLVVTGILMMSGRKFA
ncbi:MAG: hypothetical protein ACYC3X_21125 [Pirellulaceae bacterium]